MQKIDRRSDDSVSGIFFTIDSLVYFTQRVRKDLNENKFTTCAVRDLKFLDSIKHTIVLKKTEMS